MKKLQGKIGVFDSGLGGLAILRKIVSLMPEREYLYLGDNLRAPYGNRSQKKIYCYTRAGVEWLFANGAELVILACNTASANALRKIQQEVLSLRYPNKRVLGIIIPTVEEVAKFSKSGHIGVLATKATVAAKVFEKEARKRNSEIKIKTQAGGNLAELIENFNNEKALKEEVKKVISRLIIQDKLMDTLVLGCTHYALIEDEIKKILPKNIGVIDQGSVVAEKLADYLRRHKEIREKLSNKSSVCFYTTSGREKVKKMMAQFYEKEIPVLTVGYEVI